MTSHRADGIRIEAALLARYQHTVRVAVRGADDAVEFNEWNGTWISEDCEPVWIEFDWDERSAEPSSQECAFLCSPERGRRVIDALRSDERKNREALLGELLTTGTSYRVS